MKEEEILNGSLLFFLVKLDEDDKLSSCDGELNENYGWSYDDCYEDSYLLTRNEIISLKEKLGDKIVFLKDDMADYEEFVKGKYHVIPADDITDDAVQTIMSYMDGQIVLDRKVAESGIYPAIDVFKSTSKLIDIDKFVEFNELLFDIS